MTPADGPLTVAGHDESGEHLGHEVDRLCRVAEHTLRTEGVTDGHLDIFFVDPDTMAGLNETHLGHDGPTDVLAFPLDAVDDEPGPAPPDGDGPPRHLGDVVVCPAVARRQAPEHCGRNDAELTLLVVHGVLHVLGHDHAADDERLVMQDRERRHLAIFGFRHPVAS
ncbi:MAG: rRNA maturation RNase YbeY [Acidimicrobiales bacterium]